MVCVYVYVYVCVVFVFGNEHLCSYVMHTHAHTLSLTRTYGAPTRDRYEAIANADPDDS